MTAFDRAWDLVKFYEDTPLNQQTGLSRQATEALGLGAPFAQGAQRRVFDIKGEPDFVAKVPNYHAGGDELSEQLRLLDLYNDPRFKDKFDKEPMGEKDSFWEAFTYDRMKNVLPGVAEKYLLPAEQMTSHGRPVNAMRMPRVDMSWLEGEDSQYRQAVGPGREWDRTIYVEGKPTTAEGPLTRGQVNASAFDDNLQNWWDQLAEDAYEEAKNNPKTSFEFGGKRGVNAQLLDELKYYFGSDNINDIGPGNYHAPNYPSTEGMRMLDYYAEPTFLGDFTTPSTPNMVDERPRVYRPFG
tara:strand:+ start:1696 stop:2589 length:894 start_codon:yes stop_codon:yes gene_type:complete